MMYDYIHGKLVVKRPTDAVVDVQGLGFYFKISVSTSQSLPLVGEMVTLKTYLHVREDTLQLFGFFSEDEREIFLALLAVSGIGPKLAQTILSGLTPERFVGAVRNGDEKTLNSISGVGKKTAQRLIVELKDKLARFTAVSEDREMAQQGGLTDTIETEAAMALLSLGYSKQQAEKAVLKARKNEPVITAEELIKKALQTI